MRIGQWMAALTVVAASGGAMAATKPAPRPAARPAAAPAPARGPVVYWLSASTSTGMAGGGGASMAAMMAGGRFNPNAVNHGLMLQLGSPRRPQGEPNAEHLPPQGLGAGSSLPLVTPVAQPREPTAPQPPTQYQRPNGRMLVFWGCGEHAGPGQPLVIDYAKLGQGSGAQQMAALTGAFGALGSQPPSAVRNTTYGEWPNERTRGAVPADGSLTGEHLVRGNYTPDIAFSLTPNQDFLPPFQLTTNVRNPAGSATLAWRRVDGASAFFASLMGGGRDNTTVIWTSSQAAAAGFGLPEYLGTGDVKRLLASHVLLAPTSLSCVVPQEAVRAVGEGGLFNLVAFGDETDFAFPPRPADPKAAWSPQWTVKVRYRSSVGGLLGMDMSQMGYGGGGADE
jgi:hypothetical protein